MYGVDDDYDGAVDEGCPKLTVSIDDASVLESRRLAKVTVRLSEFTDQWVLVSHSIKDKTAVHPNDYIRISIPLLFIPECNRTAKVYIPIINDHEAEGSEQFEIRLRNPFNVSIADGIGIVTVMDNDMLVTDGKAKAASLRLQAYPNPSQGVFTIRLKGTDYTSNVVLRVYDITGRIKEVRNNVYVGQSIQLGDQYRVGLYIIEAEQGKKRVQTKVIKSRYIIPLSMPVSMSSRDLHHLTILKE